jgi:hypothetical protein
VRNSELPIVPPGGVKEADMGARGNRLEEADVGDGHKGSPRMVAAGRTRTVQLIGAIE